MRPSIYYLHVNSDISEWCQENEIKILRQFQNLKGFMAVLVPFGIEETLENNTNITSYSTNFRLNLENNSRIIRQDTGNWGLDRIDQRNLPLNQKYRFANQGLGVDIYIIDTGINIDHREFGARANILHDSFRVPTDSKYGLDDNGHGTHVAGIAAGNTYGVANLADIWAAKAFNAQGSTTLGSLLEAYDAVLLHYNSRTRPAVANCSFTGPKSDTLNQATKQLIDAGIITCVAAGNSGADANGFSPASLQEAITVGASDRNDRYAFFSNTRISTIGVSSGPNNFGSAVDIIAPGIDINSAYIPGKDTIRSLSGTSMASPFVAGACALYLEINETASPNDVKNYIIESSTKNIVDLTEQAETSGTPNRLLYISTSPTTITWNTQSGLLASVQENMSLVTFVEATSNDIDNNELSITYEIVAGALPPGFILGKLDGKISGIAPDVTQTTVFQFTVRANDGSSVADRTFEIIIQNVNSPPVWSQETPSNLNISYGDIFVNDDIIIDFTSFIHPVTGNNFEAAFDPDGDPLTFTLVGGELPNDLVLTLDGKIQGLISALSSNESSEQLFEFTIRISDGVQYRDKSFFVTIKQDSDDLTQNPPPVWATPDWTNGPIATFEPTQVIKFQLVAVDENSDNLTYKLDDTNFPPPELPAPIAPSDEDEFVLVNEESEFGEVIPNRTTFVNLRENATGIYYGLPSGVHLRRDGSIVGEVDCDPLPGIYYFQVNVSDGKSNALRIFSLEVNGEILLRTDGVPFVELTTEQKITALLQNNIIEQRTLITPPLDDVTWETKEGLIGTLSETYPAFFKLKAFSPTGSKIVYRLAPFSKRMPEGLFIERETGEIRGRVQYITRTKDFEFTVRAEIEGAEFLFADRKFIIRIEDRFQEPIESISFVITGDDKVDWLDWHLDPGIIPDQLIYRLGDQNFGRVTFPKMEILSGFPKLSSSNFFEIINLNNNLQSPPSTYHQKLMVHLGELKIAKARDDFGNEIYQVLYYDVVDPHDAVGGFENGAEVEQLYPQRNLANNITYKNIQIFYPKSIKNWRKNIKNRIGFVNEERLPLWMTSEQEFGNPDSIIGWKPAIVVAYILPETGTTNTIQNSVFGQIESNSEIVFNRKCYLIDRYLLEDYSYIIQKTEFDKTSSFETRFDEDFSITLFDAVERKSNERYYKFPPGDIFGYAQYGNK